MTVFQVKQECIDVSHKAENLSKLQGTFSTTAEHNPRTHKIILEDKANNPQAHQSLGKVNVFCILTDNTSKVVLQLNNYQHEIQVSMYTELQDILSYSNTES